MSEHDRPPPSLVVTLGALTVVSGFMDAVSFLGLGHVFTANMTGNVLLLGFAAAGAPGLSFGASLCALGAFAVGAVGGGRLAAGVQPVRNLLLVAMIIEAGCTASAAIVAGTAPAVGSGWARYTIISLLALSLGQRNAAVRRVGVPDMPTTVLTTALTNLTSNSLLAGGTNPHPRLARMTILCMFGGALVGAALVLHAGPAWALGVVAGIVALTAAYFSREVPLDITSP